jgi:hypothetical protein
LPGFAEKGLLTPGFYAIFGQQPARRRAGSRLGASVNLGKKKILPGHRLSGVSGWVCDGVPAVERIGNDTA